MCVCIFWGEGELPLTVLEKTRRVQKRVRCYLTLSMRHEERRRARALWFYIANATYPYIIHLYYYRVPSAPVTKSDLHHRLHEINAYILHPRVIQFICAYIFKVIARSCFTPRKKTVSVHPLGFRAHPATKRSSRRYFSPRSKLPFRRIGFTSRTVAYTLDTRVYFYTYGNTFTTLR